MWKLEPLSRGADSSAVGSSASRVGRNTLLYGVSFLLQRAAGFVMLPVYTRYLHPSDYATAQLLGMSQDVASILLSAGVTAGVGRFYFKATTDAERHAVVVAALGLLALFNALGAVLLAVAAPWVAGRLLEDAALVPLVYLVSWSFVLDAAVTIPTLYMQMTERAGLYVLASLTRLALQLGLNVTLIVGYGEGVRGILWATLGMYLVMVPPCLLWLVRQVGFRTRWSAVKDLWRFGLPYRVTEAGNFILTYADRYFLVPTWGKTVTGVYALAYQFGFLTGYVGVVPFHMAWNPQRFQLANEAPEKRNPALQAGLHAFSAVVLTVGVGVSIYTDSVLLLLGATAYADAARLVPVIVLAYVLQGYKEHVEFAIHVSEETRAATVATWLSVVAILGLYATLIPPYGALGAAWATAIAFGVRLVAFAVAAHRLWPIPYRLGPTLRLAGYAVTAVVAYQWLAAGALLERFLTGTAIVLVYFVAMTFGGVFDATARGTIFGLIRRRLARTPEPATAEGPR